MILTMTGCEPVPDAPLPPPQTAAPSFDVFEQALIGVAIKMIERNGQTARLVSHHMSKTAAVETLCGVYFIENDPLQRKRYFLSRANGAWLLEGQSDERWQRNC